jgi:uncharacterized repeat protein (TIGR03847 family)
MSSFDFQDIDRWVVGAVGEPGRRLFLMQITAGPETCTIKTEKERVAALSSLLAQILEGVEHFGHLSDDNELQGPLDIAFVSGSWSVEWDETMQRYRVEIAGIGTPDDEGSDEIEQPNDYVRFLATQEQLASIAIAGRALVEAGRPNCPLCNYPMDPGGHACPRSNGNRPPTL